MSKKPSVKDLSVGGKVTADAGKLPQAISASAGEAEAALRGDSNQRGFRPGQALEEAEKFAKKFSGFNWGSDGRPHMEPYAKRVGK